MLSSGATNPKLPQTPPFPPSSPKQGADSGSKRELPEREEPANTLRVFLTAQILGAGCDDRFHGGGELCSGAQLSRLKGEFGNPSGD